jgi:hypothetical protein
MGAPSSTGFAGCSGSLGEGWGLSVVSGVTVEGEGSSTGVGSCPGFEGSAELEGSGEVDGLDGFTGPVGFVELVGLVVCAGSSAPFELEPQPTASDTQVQPKIARTFIASKSTRSA